MISTDSRKDKLVRTEPPPIKDPADFEVKLPVCDVRKLSNGVEVYLLNMGSEDTMMINLVFYSLVEVGTTNRTHLDDYRRAITSSTGAIAKIHRSNFAQSGFVAEVDVPALALIASEHGIPIIHDLGSGLESGAAVHQDRCAWRRDAGPGTRFG